MTRMLHAQTTYYILAAIALLLAFFVGAALFSYLYELARRLRGKAAQTGGRSCCPHCGHPFTIWEAWPVFGYLRYRGCCMYCFEPLPRGKLWAELAGGLCGIVLTAVCTGMIPRLIRML